MHIYNVNYYKQYCLGINENKHFPNCFVSLALKFPSPLLYL